MREPRHFEAPLCAEIGGDLWFPEKEGSDTNHELALYAKSICRRCDHQVECAEWGIHNESFGVWGGLSSRELERTRSRLGIKKREIIAQFIKGLE